MGRELTRFERLEIQMEYAVPLLRGLQAELGDDVILDALQRQLGKRIDAAASVSAEKSTTPDMSRVAAGMEPWAEGGALDYRVVEDGDEQVGLDVDRCSYAEMMIRLDAADFGSILICGEDHVGAARVGMNLDRPHTHMTGHDVCDFRFTPIALGTKPT